MIVLVLIAPATTTDYRILCPNFQISVFKSSRFWPQLYTAVVLLCLSNVWTTSIRRVYFGKLKPLISNRNFIKKLFFKQRFVTKKKILTSGFSLNERNVIEIQPNLLISNLLYLEVYLSLELRNSLKFEGRIPLFKYGNCRYT